MKFYIEIDNPSYSYAGGENISGQVVVELDNEELTTGMIVNCFGSAEVHWSEDQNPDVHHHGPREQLIHGATTVAQTEEIKRHTALTSVEKYFEYNALLFGHHDGTEILIPAGMEKFPFSFELPVGIPSSFQNQGGNVEYVLEAKIKRSKFDYDTKCTFDVLGQLDLNKYPGAAYPAEIRQQKNICCLCCKSGPFGFSLKLNKTGFIPGETIGFVANLFNMSSKELQKNTFQFIQHISFHSGGKSMHDCLTLLELNGPILGSGETKVWEEQDVLIPFIPATKLGGCKIIGVEYEIQIVMEVPNRTNLVGTIPIIIGTTPFQIDLFDGNTETISEIPLSSLPESSASVPLSVRHSKVDTAVV